MILFVVTCASSKFLKVIAEPSLALLAAGEIGNDIKSYTGISLKRMPDKKMSVKIMRANIYMMLSTSRACL